MAYYLYIIESLTSGDLYKGVTQDVNQRLNDHNAGRSRFTKSDMPWKLVYLKEFGTKSDVLKEELRLKKCNRVYLEWLIAQPINLLRNERDIEK